MFVPEMTPIQPVNVIIHNPPGISEFAKTMLSASVGFLFGIAGNVLMEFVKPKFEMQRRKDLVIRQVHPEFLQNMNAVDGAMQLLDAVVDEGETVQMSTCFFANQVLSDFRHDRFDQCFEKEKDAAYAVDNRGNLVRFYEKFKEKMGVAKDMSYQDLRWFVNGAFLFGRMYLGDAHLERIAKPHPMAELYLEVIAQQKEEKKGAGGGNVLGAPPKA